MATTTWPAEVYVFDGTHWVSISPHGMTTLPPATGTTIGGVIVGAGINVAPDGTISVTHFSGDYNDLTNKPVIQAPVQSDWLATGGDAFIVNKPNYLSQFTNDLSVSAFPNDALYVDAAAAAAAAPIQSIAAGANVAISDDGHGNIVIAATGGGSGTPGGGVVSVSGTAPIKVVDGLKAPVISLVLGTGLKVNSGALEADFSGLATVATSGSYNDLSDKPTIPPTYTLPAASGTVLGGVKVGTGLTMTGEVLSATGTTVPDASTTTKGIIQIADAANITAGTALRAVDAAGLKAVTDQQTKDFVNVSGDTMTGALTIPDGTAAAPSLKFDDATGIYQPAANTWAVSTGGVERLRVNADGQIQTGTGTAVSPSIYFKSDPDTGTFSPAANTWAVSTAGVERLRVKSNGRISVGLGAEATPILCNDHTPSTGMYFANSNDVSFSTSAVRRVGIDAGGLSVYQFHGGTDVGRLRMMGDDGSVSLSVLSYGSSYSNITALGASAGDDVVVANRGSLFVGTVAAQSLVLSTANAERLRVDATGDLLAATGYTPANDQSLATKKYVDDAVAGTPTARGILGPASPPVTNFKPTTEPAAGHEGDVYFDSTTKKLRVYDGTAWADLH